MLIHLDKENFNEEIKEGKVVVDFFATWCGPCKLLGPIIEELAKEEENVKFIKVDVDQFEDLARAYGIMSVPTVIYFRDGEVVDQTIGFLPKDVLKEKLKNL